MAANVRADIAMAGDAVCFLAFPCAMDLADQGGMAIDAVVLRHTGIEGADADRIGEVAGGEGDAMVPAVDAFDDVFGREGVRRVAVVTGGHIFMAGVVPGVELCAHDVTVFARRRVVGEIGEPLAVIEGEKTQPGKDADQQGHAQAPKASRRS